MSVFLFCFLIIPWTIVTIRTNNFLPCFVALFFSVVIFLFSSKPLKVQLPKTLLAFSKGILLISFWACVAFCLLSYQKSIVCTTCIYNHLKEADILSSNIIQTAWTLYPRFIIINGLFILWVIILSQTTQKGAK